MNDDAFLFFDCRRDATAMRDLISFFLLRGLDD